MELQLERAGRSVCESIRQMTGLVSPLPPAGVEEVLARWHASAAQMLQATHDLLRLTTPGLREQARAAVTGPPPQALRILIAEDTDFAYELLRRFLREEPYEVARAHHGAEALSMVQSGEFDVVLMDVQMPLMDGYIATRRIREWEAGEGRQRIPIVLVSGEEAARQMRLGGTAGCSGYLTKPVSKSHLLTALKLYGPAVAASAR